MWVPTAVLLLLSLSLCLPTQGAFVHPGVLMNKAQLDFIKVQVLAKVEPVYTAMVNANATSIAGRHYVPKVVYLLHYPPSCFSISLWLC